MVLNFFLDINFCFKDISSRQATLNPCLFSIISIKFEASSKLDGLPVSNQAKPLPILW